MSARWLRAPWPLYHLLQSLRSLADRPTILLSIFLFGTGLSLRRDPGRAHHLELIPFARGPLCPNYVLCLRALCPLLAGYLWVPGLTCHQANVSTAQLRQGAPESVRFRIFRSLEEDEMRRISSRKPWLLFGSVMFGVLLALASAGPSGAQTAGICKRQLTANVVALDQVFFYNRLGAENPAGMIYALRRDVIDNITNRPEADGGVLSPGRVQLRPDKRPRPLVLRMNVHDCLTINFQNLLNRNRVHMDQPVTRNAGVHVTGMQLVNTIADDGSFVGANATSLAAPGDRRTYTIYAEREGMYFLFSPAAMNGAEGEGGTLSFGLFGSVNVEPEGAEYYRSEVTNADLRAATQTTMPSGQPMLDYDAVYPPLGPRAGTPVLNMVQNNEIMFSDLNAIITGPGRSNFPAGTYPPNPTLEPNAKVPQVPGGPLRTRAEPFREFTVIFHDEIFAVQAFPGFYTDPVFKHTLNGVKDGFAINYGTAGIGSEILANRLGVGPVFACNECKYEEFFLNSWALGDPAMVVDIPANAGLESLAPGQTPPANAVGPKATKVFYPDDPSNVHN